MMGRLYSEDAAHFEGGMPAYFYVLFLAIKTPLPILGALIIGLVETWKRRRESGPSFLIFMFLWWIVPFLAARRQVAPIHARVDAGGLHHRRDWAGQDLFLVVRAWQAGESIAGWLQCLSRPSRSCLWRTRFGLS